MQTDFLFSGSLIPPYIAYPRFLIELDISETAKLIYALLLDRARLSMNSDEFKDNIGKAYVYFTIETLAKMTGKSEITIKKTLKILQEQNLILRIHQGFCKPSKIFVKVPQGIKNDTLEVSKNIPHEYKKLTCQ